MIQFDQFIAPQVNINTIVEHRTSDIFLLDNLIRCPYITFKVNSLTNYQKGQLFLCWIKFAYRYERIYLGVSLWCRLSTIYDSTKIICCTICRRVCVIYNIISRNLTSAEVTHCSRKPNE